MGGWILIGEVKTPTEPRLFVLLMRQDDPRKCTAMKLLRFGLISAIPRISHVRSRSILLNPLAGLPLTPMDRSTAERYGIVALDCSWERVGGGFSKRIRGVSRRLPTLLASNPTNYGVAHKLSTVEAFAAALFILGFRDGARRLLSLFKWGSNFLTLNSEPLEAYSSAATPDEIRKFESEFF